MAGPVTVGAISACSVTAVTAVTTWAAADDQSLLPALGSVVSAALSTELLSGPLGGAVTMTVKFPATSLASPARDQVTTPALYAPPLEAETNEAPAGSV